PGRICGGEQLYPERRRQPATRRDQALSAPHRPGAAAVSAAAQGNGGQPGGLRDRGWLATLRRIERETHGPRIGRNARLAQEAVRLGQDPFLAFPAEDFTPPRDAAPGPA